MNAMSFFLAIFYVQKNRVMLKFEWEIIIRTKIEWSKYQKFFIKLRFCYESIAGRIWDTPNCNIVAQQLVLMALTSPHCPQKKKSKLRRKEHVPHKHEVSGWGVKGKELEEPPFVCRYSQLVFHQHFTSQSNVNCCFTHLIFSQFIM